MVKTASIIGGTGLIPVEGTKISHATQCGQNLKKKKKKTFPECTCTYVCILSSTFRITSCILFISTILQTFPHVTKGFQTFPQWQPHLSSLHFGHSRRPAEKAQPRREGKTQRALTESATHKVKHVKGKEMHS